MITRRSAVLGGAALFGSVANGCAVRPGRAQVFRDYTRAELDIALDQKRYAPNWQELVAKYQRRSEAAIERLPPTTHAYGAAAEERLDIYQAKGTGPAPVLMLFHGGGWRMMGRRDVAYAAQTFTEAGITLVAPGYTLLPAGSVRNMAAQAQRAVRWVHENIGEHGGDPARISVGGLSAGAHLAGILLATDWAREGLRTNPVKGGVLVSGIYDVAALAASTVYGYTNLTRGDVELLSPIRHLERWRAPVLVAWAEREPPEFKRQSLELVGELKRRGRPCTPLEARGKTHFDIALDLGTPGSELAQRAIAQIRNA